MVPIHVPRAAGALTGHSLIGGKPVPGGAGTIRAVNPATGEQLGPEYSLLSVEEAAVATKLAAEAAPSYAELAPEKRAAFLETIADNLDAATDAIVERACLETGLPAARLTGEVARSSACMRLFANTVRQGDHFGVRIDPADPDAKPTPRVDMRQLKVPYGPVAVFGAANFPIAFAAAGGDTASALAAGCPVVYKGHHAHPGTTEILSHAIAEAVREHDLHPGVFSMVQGRGRDVGQALVADPLITAVGFTGSRKGGLAVLATASHRPVPIPVYAEMSAVNPVSVLPGAIDTPEKIAALASSYIASVTGSAGQLCTLPGIVFVPTGADGDAFVEAAGREISQVTGQVMLTSAIADACRLGARAWGESSGVRVVAKGTSGPGPNAPAPVLVTAPLAAFHAEEALRQEVFGAASVLVRYETLDELVETLSGFEGQLTGTIQMDPANADDAVAARKVLPVLTRFAGRVIVNGWPTGVAVTSALVHGGPFPATSAPATTSVGSLAIDRFLRPVAFQNFPAELLPPALQDANPLSLNRRVNGEIRLA